MKKKQNKKKNISYKLNFTGSTRIIASSLSTLVDNLSEGIHKIKCKYRHGNKNGKDADLNTKIASAILKHNYMKKQIFTVT